EIVGVLSCWDRIIVHGTLPGFGHSAGMTSHLTAHGIRIFDYTKFAEPLRDQIRRNAERLATENGIEIESCSPTMTSRSVLTDSIELAPPRDCTVARSR
ncbi:MAG: hypothetical protein JW751_20215, partial [Polyangiaceae bacterium]|nr:hypothetical protein [Polyangiaceae bacterium]